MKKLALLYTLASAFLLLASCSDGEGEISPNSNAIQVVSAATSLKAVGDALTITVNKDITKVYTSENWLSVSSEGKTVSFAAAANKSRESRNANIVIKASETDSTVVSVSQQGLVFSYSDGNVVVANAGGKIAKAVVNNEGFQVMSAPDWVSCSVDGDSLRMNIAENTSDDVRKGFVSFGTGQFKETVEVLQGSFEDNFLGEEFVLMGYNRDNQVEMYRAKLFEWKNLYYLSLPDLNYTYGIEFDDETLTMKISNLQAIGSYLNTYYVFSSYIASDSYPYLSTDIIGNFKFDIMSDDSGDIVYAPLTGKIGNLDIIGISFLLYTTNIPDSNPSGQANYLTNVTLLKMDAEDIQGAKAFMNAKQYIMRP